MNGKGKLTRALFQRLQQSVLIGTIVLGGYMTPSLASAAQQLPKVPTTKIIAIGSLTATATPEAVSAVLPEEVRETVKLSLAGKIEQWNVRTDKSGVVFVLNITDVAEARDMFAKMPLDRAGLMTFEFIPVGPLSPLALLLEQPAR